jgi:hypothetical protein
MHHPSPAAGAARRASGAALTAVLLLAPLCGCGSSSAPSNGVASQAPAQILASTQAAAYAANSAHVSGSLTSDGEKITLDLDLLAGKGGRGQLSENGLSFELIDTGGYVYIKGSPAFYSHIAGSATAQLFVGKWLKAPAASGNFASLASLTDLHSLIQTTLQGHGTLGKGAPTTVDGQDVIPLTDATKGGTLYVATKGKAYPVEIIKQGSNGGQVAFASWNAPVSLVAPANAVDLTKLQSGG